MNNNAVIATNEQFEISEVGESIIILEPNLEEVYIVNGVEKDIWELIDGDSTVADIIDSIENIYEGDGIESDIKEFLQSLIDKKIIYCMEPKDV